MGDGTLGVGAIYDVSLLTDTAVVATPEEYRLIDDRWASYFARRRGWRLRRSSAAFVPMERDGRGLASGLVKKKTDLRRLLASRVS